MKNKFFIVLIIFSLLLVHQRLTPNVIIIISDDQGYADVGFHGSKEIFTPNIDRIAKNGVVFPRICFICSVFSK